LSMTVAHRRWRGLATVLALAGLAIASSIDGAFAHGFVEDRSYYENGLLHAITSPVLIVAMSAIGFALGKVGREWDWLSAAIFVGALLASLAVPESIGLQVFTMAAPLLLAVAGIILLLFGPLLKWSLPPLAALMGLVAGVTLYLDGPADDDWPWFVVGAAVSSGIVSVVAAIAWRWLERPWMIIAARIVGAWLVAVGVMLAGLVWNDVTAL